MQAARTVSGSTNASVASCRHALQCMPLNDNTRLLCTAACMERAAAPSRFRSLFISLEEAQQQRVGGGGGRRSPSGGGGGGGGGAVPRMLGRLLRPFSLGRRLLSSGRGGGGGGSGHSYEVPWSTRSTGGGRSSRASSEVRPCWGGAPVRTRVEGQYGAAGMDL